MYPGIAGSEPCGLHGPAGDGASSHHLGQDGPIAAFLIVIWVPGGRGRTRASAACFDPSCPHNLLGRPYLVTARGKADLGNHTTIWEL